MRDKVKIAVFVSGGGTNLQALIDAERAGLISDGEIALVICNRSGAYALERAASAGIDAEVVTRKACGGQEGFEARILELLEARGIELIVLAGFLAILGGELLKEYADKIVNIHPSLIPSFCGDGYYGLKVHEEALKYGVKVTGATAHLVNEITDGGRILIQKAVYVQDGDTPEILQKRVMEEAEWNILPEAVEMVCKGEI